MSRNQNVLDLLALLCLAGLLIRSGEALRCLPCSMKDCEPKPTNCANGFTKDICQCCDVCAKGLGETCGGTWNMHLSCGTGLKCDSAEGSNRPGKCQLAKN